MVTQVMGLDVDSAFAQYFPDLAARHTLKDFQRRVISNVFSHGNTLCIMQTGGGKSWIYWVSGLALNGTTLVIAPLIALIDEQSEKIREHGYEVLTVHSGLDASKQVESLRKFADGSLNPDFIFVSPERLSTDGFFGYCLSARRDDIKLVTVDEVHCVSQWGDSFRPFYKRIPVFLSEVYGRDSWGPAVLALTATLNPKEVQDIVTEFRIDKHNILRDELLIRSEIDIRVIKFGDEDAKEDKLWELLNIHRNEKTLVYLYRKYHKRGVEDLSSIAVAKGFKATSFHGEMSAKERQYVIRQYRNNDVDVVFATNAFGMGIDIPDIRNVIHFMIPESVEQYYQEIGRAARDKEPANAYVLYTDKNVQVRRDHFIDKSFPTTEELHECYARMTGGATGVKTLQYYEEESVQLCLPYFLDSGLVSILCKGFLNLNMLSDIEDATLRDAYAATKTKGLLSTVKRTGLDVDHIVSMVYEAVLKGKARLVKTFDKCLIVNVDSDRIPCHTMDELIQYVEERKEYKHRLLDYLVYLLNECTSSTQLHQEIGRYLGVPKHLLGRIYATLKGDRVRSKSEVIIANILFQNGVQYEYERRLYYEPDRWMEPDFTISMPDDTEVYWEHLGLIGSESYDEAWTRKLDTYEKHFPGQLVKTYESTAVSDSAQRLLNELGLV